MESYIKTVSTNCKECCKCVLHCSVKAIRMNEGHAEIVPEKCILDGKCIQACPQNAKEVVSQLNEVKKILKSGEFVVLSLAPSFPAVFSEYTPFQIYRAFKELGFSEIEETAVAAHYVALEYQKLVSVKDMLISSDCPSAVNLIEIYHPHLLKYLAPITSPMIAHSIMLRKGFKEKFNKDIKIVFAGPCIAKIDEASRSKRSPDFVISFREIIDWLKEEGINISELSQSIITSEYHAQAARMYPLEGGLLKSIGLEHFHSKYFSVTGFSKCNDFLSKYDFESHDLKIAELMVCDDGCVNGPLSANDFPPLIRKKIFEYDAKHEHLPVLFDYDNLEVDISRSFENRYIKPKEYTEEQIIEVLRRTGRDNKEEQLNCGSCGYNLCRDRAIAVLDGMLEIDMCIPYMKKRAESRAYEIIERSPNGVIEVSRDYRIVHYNTTFKELFGLPNCKDIMGQPIKNFLDIELFEEGRIDKKTFITKVPNLNKEIEVRVYDLLEDEMHVAIVIDITQRVNDKKNLYNLKKETIDKTTDVIHKQMRVAQEIASLLGETTAETKATLLDLMNVIKKEGD